MQTERRFNLIKTDFEQHEKRIFPRFPFCYLTFKSEQNNTVFEVKDISYTGMQLGPKHDSNLFDANQTVSGTIHWLGSEIHVHGNVKWTTNSRIGVEFTKRETQFKVISDFLSLDRLVRHLKPLHRYDYGVELPARLKYWLRSDGPVELFMWQHGDGELAKFQVLLLDQFVEWEDGVGLKTGRIMSKRNVDTPLLSEDEVVFRMDGELDEDKLHRVRDLVSRIGQELLQDSARDFLQRKLS